MTRPTILSGIILASAVICVVVGVYLSFGLGVALIVLGVLLGATELLVR